jgi:nickel/cobalt transporter (NicO) family protein
MLGAAGVMLALAQPALAHPHIMIDARAIVRFDEQGRVAGLTHSWTFDTAFSVWMVQGLDTDGDGTVSPAEMQGLADENMVGLGDFHFYTYAGDDMAFTAVGDQGMVYENNRVTLSYSIDAVEPQAPGERFELGIYDPEYYVAITVNDVTDVTLDNAPEGCVVRLEPPVPMAPEIEERLYSLGPEVLELPPGRRYPSAGRRPKSASTCRAAASSAGCRTSSAISMRR